VHVIVGNEAATTFCSATNDDAEGNITVASFGADGLWLRPILEERRVLDLPEELRPEELRPEELRPDELLR
jgi:hypothetical protein